MTAAIPPRAGGALPWDGPMPKGDAPPFERKAKLSSVEDFDFFETPDDYPTEVSSANTPGSADWFVPAITSQTYTTSFKVAVSYGPPGVRPQDDAVASPEPFQDDMFPDSDGVYWWYKKFIPEDLDCDDFAALTSSSTAPMLFTWKGTHVVGHDEETGEAIWQTNTYTATAFSFTNVTYYTGVAGPPAFRSTPERMAAITALFNAMYERVYYGQRNGEGKSWDPKYGSANDLREFRILATNGNFHTCPNSVSLDYFNMVETNNPVRTISSPRFVESINLKNLAVALRLDRAESLFGEFIRDGYCDFSHFVNCKREAYGGWDRRGLLHTAGNHTPLLWGTSYFAPGEPSAHTVKDYPADLPQLTIEGRTAPAVIGTSSNFPFCSLAALARDWRDWGEGYNGHSLIRQVIDVASPYRALAEDLDRYYVASPTNCNYVPYEPIDTNGLHGVCTTVYGGAQPRSKSQEIFRLRDWSSCVSNADQLMGLCDSTLIHATGNPEYLNPSFYPANFAGDGGSDFCGGFVKTLYSNCWVSVGISAWAKITVPISWNSTLGYHVAADTEMPIEFFPVNTSTNVRTEVSERSGLYPAYVVNIPAALTNSTVSSFDHNVFTGVVYFTEDDYGKAAGYIPQIMPEVFSGDFAAEVRLFDLDNGFMGDNINRLTCQLHVFSIDQHGDPDGVIDRYGDFQLNSTFNSCEVEMYAQVSAERTAAAAWYAGISTNSSSDLLLRNVNYNRIDRPDGSRSFWITRAGVVSDWTNHYESAGVNELEVYMAEIMGEKQSRQHDVYPNRDYTSGSGPLIRSIIDEDGVTYVGMDVDACRARYIRQDDEMFDIGWDRLRPVCLQLVDKVREFAHEDVQRSGTRLVEACEELVDRISIEAENLEADPFYTEEPLEVLRGAPSGAVDSVLVYCSNGSKPVPSVRRGTNDWESVSLPFLLLDFGFQTYLPLPELRISGDSDHNFAISCRPLIMGINRFNFKSLKRTDPR